MDIKNVLLKLADGEMHSGEDLGDALSVSRAAVWKSLKKLEEIGIIVEAVKGRGYRIEGGLELLDRNIIKRNIKNQIQELDIFWVIDSTNKITLEKCNEGLGHRYVCLAEMQTAGRGRRGKPWVSPFGKNIYLSLGWQFSGGAKSLEGLSLAVGVCLARVLKSLKVGAVGLKWPNDVLASGKKITGILLEMSGDATGVCQIVIGVGLNVEMKFTGQYDKIDQPFTDISHEIGYRPSRNTLVPLIVDELVSMLAVYESQGFSAFKDEWQELDLCFGKNVTLTTPAYTILGTAKGVNNSGAIIIENESGQREYSGGEISLRISP